MRAVLKMCFLIIGDEDFEGLASAESLADQLEDAIFIEFKDTGMKYKNRIRSRILNLKDVKNPDLKNNLMSGALPPSKLAVMTTEVCVYFEQVVTIHRVLL